MTPQWAVKGIPKPTPAGVNGVSSSGRAVGWRGSPKLDRGAVAHCLVVLGDWLSTYPNIQMIEINPLRVYPCGVLALDASLLVKSGGSASPIYGQGPPLAGP